MKTEREHFADWEAHIFGYGYGTGEEHTLAALKAFLAHTEPQYEYDVLERVLGPTVAWLMINILCHADIVEYGTSPRFGWLTPEGKRLREFVDPHSANDLAALVCDRSDDYIVCYPDACNCGPQGYEPGRDCGNPFWKPRQRK